MAFLGGTFDATSVDPKGEYEVIAPGDYVVQIEASEMKPTKTGNGQYLQIELMIIDGPQAGRKLFDRLNLDNPNAQAVEIAQRTLSAICHATGKMSVQDSDELHGIPMIATVKVKPAQGQYGASNEIGTYKPKGGAAPAAGGFTQQSAPQSGFNPAAQQSASGGAAAPWKRAATG